MRIFLLEDPKTVLEAAKAKSPKRRSWVERLLMQLYHQAEEMWSKLPQELTLQDIPDEALEFVIVGRNDKNGFVMPATVTRPDFTDAFLKGLENVYGEGFTEIRDNHAFTIYTAQYLTWAMQSPQGSIPRTIFDRFKQQMRHLYRQASIEDVLNVRWIGKKWDAIYPSLAKLEEAEDRSFREKVRELVLRTVEELLRL
jgi:hypothetical protein